MAVCKKWAVSLSLVMACGVVGRDASAHEFCVTTSSELRDALAATSDGGVNQDENNLILVVTGTYLTSDTSSRFLYMNTSATSEIHIWGGENPDCMSNTDDVSLTVLDGGGATQVLVLRSTVGTVDVLRMTLQNANTDQFGGGLSINDIGSASGDVYVRNMIIRNNHTSATYGGFRAFARPGHTLYFDATLVYGNSADNGFGAGELYGDANVYARYDTITRNTSPGTLSGGLFCGGTPACELANDALWQNSNSDLYLFTDASLYFDDIGVMTGAVPSISVGVLDLDPVFIDADNGDFRLGFGSPLVGVSTYLNSQSDNDNEGHELPLSGKTDIGALMDTVFNDEFESP